MEPEELIIARLKTQLAHVWGEKIPEGGSLPAAVVTIIDDLEEQGVGGELHALLHAHVQIDCYALTASARAALKNQVITLMITSTDFQCVISGGGENSTEEETGYLRNRKEYSCWFNT